MKWLPYLNHINVVNRQAILNWMDNGCPNSDLHWENYIISKRSYKHAVRECKRNRKTACAFIMVDASSRYKKLLFYLCLLLYNDK